MPNLTGVSANPFFSTGLVELNARISSRRAAIVRRRFELGDELVDHVVLDGHAVGRDVALGRAVEIRLADVERIAAERARDVVDDVLDRDRALRTAEAAKRRVRLRVGLAGQRENVDVGEVVGIVEVAHRARADRTRKVRGKAGAGRHLDLRGADQAVVAVAHLVVVVEAVALARLPGSRRPDRAGS